jgi:hypothetical protein
MDLWREQQAEGLAAGKPFKKTLEEVASEYTLSELGGQVRATWNGSRTARRSGWEQRLSVYRSHQRALSSAASSRVT